MVAPLVIGALVGAGLGAARQKEQMRQAEQNRKLQATIASQSPWTSMQADTSNLSDPSLLGNVSQGALSGASFGMQDAFKGTEAPGASATPAAPEAPVDTGGGETAVASGNPNQGRGPLMSYQNTGGAASSPTMAMLQGGQSPWMNMDPNDPNKPTLLAGQ